MRLVNKGDKISEQSYIITNTNTSSYLKEYYDNLRNNVIFSMIPKKGKYIAITSSKIGEGKSTVAVNLAISLTKTSSKVLLIDANMNRPSVHKKLKLKNIKGLSSFLIGLDNLSVSIKNDVITGLDVLTAGIVPPNPEELFNCENMRFFLEKVYDYYDYIIIDCPAIEQMNDYTLMQLDGMTVIVVAKCEKTTYNDLERTKHLLEKNNVQILGIVATEKTEKNQ